MAILITLAFIGFIYYWLFGGRGRLSGRFGQGRVYLRRGPGLGGFALVVISIVYLSSHVVQIEKSVLMIGGTIGIGALALGLARRALKRNQ